MAVVKRIPYQIKSVVDEVSEILGGVDLIQAPEMLYKKLKGR